MYKIKYVLLIILFFSGFNISAEEFMYEEKKLNGAASNLVMYRYIRDYKKALFECAKIEKINKARGELDYAVTYKMMGEYDKAIIYSKKSIKSSKDQNISYEAPMLNMSNCYALLEDHNNLRKTLDELILIYPQSPNAYKFYAEYSEEVDDKQKALYYWREALKRFKDEVAINQAKEKIEELVAN